MKNSIMWKYIDEEPNSINRLLASQDIHQIVQIIRHYDEVIFVAHGSSFNAAITIHNFFSKMTGIHTEVFTPSQFISNKLEISKERRELIIAISQTGTSRGVIEAIEYAHRNGNYVLGMTDNADTLIERRSDSTAYIYCGNEESNAKTKGYTNTLVLLLLLAIHTGIVRKHISEQIAEDVIKEIESSLSMIPTVKNHVLQRLNEARFGKDEKTMYIIGNGMNYGTAMEGQLKIMETMCIPTAFNNTGEFSHGMHRSVNKNVDSIVIDVGEIEHNDTLTTWKFLSRNGSKSILITTNPEIQGNLVIHIPYFKLTQSVILTTLIIQVVSTFIPELNGLDPNRESHNEFPKEIETRIL